jgi:ATP-dependent Clp protease ATP-binding subunit ClpB
LGRGRRARGHAAPTLPLASPPPSPEFINRLDDLVIFDALTPEMLTDVARIAACELEARLRARGVTLSLTDAALRYAAAQSYDRAFGARPLRRFLEKQLLTELSRMLVAGEVAEGDACVVGANGSGFTYAVERGAGPPVAPSGQKRAKVEATAEPMSDDDDDDA